MEDKKSSSMLKTLVNKGISKEIWKMEEEYTNIFRIVILL